LGLPESIFAISASSSYTAKENYHHRHAQRSFKVKFTTQTSNNRKDTMEELTEELTNLTLCESTRNSISLEDRNAIVAAIRPAFARQRVHSEESSVAPYQHHFPDFDSVVLYEHPPVNKLQAGRIFMDTPLTMDVCCSILSLMIEWLTKYS
jgi:hypothetical protein